MPLDSNGNASLVPSYFVQDGDDVLPVQHNPPLEDIASMISMTLIRDGRAPMSGNLNMGVNKITNLAEPTNPTDAARLMDLSGQTSEIIYDEASVSLSSATPLSITGIAPEFRRLEIEGEISSISSAVQASYLALSVGSGGTFWEIPDNALYCLTYWAAGGASGSRRFFASIDNLDDEALSITYKTIRNPAVPPEDGNYFVTPASFSARPVDAIRIRLSTTTTVKTASVAKLRVRGIRA